MEINHASWAIPIVMMITLTCALTVQRAGSLDGTVMAMCQLTRNHLPILHFLELSLE